MQCVFPELSFSALAIRRCQQRGIPSETLALLQEFGRRVYDHRGAVRLIFDRAARRRVEATFGKSAAQVKFSVYAVVDAARRSRVITVGHRTRRCREWA